MAFYDKTVTIADGQTTSPAVDTGLLTTHSKTQLVGITFPASMTSTSMTFERATTEAGTYTPLREVGGAARYPVTVTSGETVTLDPRVFICAPYIKLVGGSSETGAKVITLHFHEVV